MAFNVRVFVHDGIDRLEVSQPRQFGSDSVYVLRQPYLNAQVISVSGVVADSAPYADPRARLLRVEVPDGQLVRYEINPPGRAIEASNSSPILSGHEQFYFRDGWTISLIDAAGLP